MYDGALMPDLAVSSFVTSDRLFPTRTIARGKQVSPLPPPDRALTRLEIRGLGKTLGPETIISRVNRRGSLGAERMDGWRSKSISTAIHGHALDVDVGRQIDHPPP